MLATPPMTQVNTPYPATAYLASYLRGLDCKALQIDFSLELILKIFTAQGLTRVRDEVVRSTADLNNPTLRFFLEAFD